MRLSTLLITCELLKEMENISNQVTIYYFINHFFDILSTYLNSYIIDRGERTFRRIKLVARIVHIKLTWPKIDEAPKVARTISILRKPGNRIKHTHISVYVCMEFPVNEENFIISSRYFAYYSDYPNKTTRKNTVARIYDCTGH